MKRLLLLQLLLAQLVSVSAVFAADTSYVLLRILVPDQQPATFEKVKYLQHELMAALQREWKKKPYVIIASSDSERVGSKQFAYVVEINVLEIRVNEPLISQQNRSVSRDVHANEYKDETEDGRKVDANVSAEIVITEKSVTAMLRLTVSTVKLPGAVPAWSQILVESYNWENKSATYNGSLQALGRKDMELVKAKPKPIPSPEEVYREVIRQCINKSSRKIANSLSL